MQQVVILPSSYIYETCKRHETKKTYLELIGQ